MDLSYTSTLVPFQSFVRRKHEPPSVRGSLPIRKYLSASGSLLHTSPEVIVSQRNVFDLSVDPTVLQPFVNLGDDPLHGFGQCVVRLNVGETNILPPGSVQPTGL